MYEYLIIGHLLVHGSHLLPAIAPFRLLDFAVVGARPINAMRPEKPSEQPEALARATLELSLSHTHSRVVICTPKPGT